jgi:lauroyl/myristoyl acyltransferase
VSAIRSRDVLDGLLMSALLPFAWLVPTRFWQGFSRALGAAHVRLLGARAGHLDRALLARLGISADELEIGFRQHNYWELMEMLREHAPWGWHARISVIGREHIDDALKEGRGAVLWYCPFTHADVVFKRGLYEAGYAINHLSAATHGFSDTRFGMAVLNPVKTSVERRYLKERCVMGDSGVGEVIRGVLDRLRRNELVSVTALQTGKRTGARSLLGGVLRLAKGAPNFALSTGAALIPVFVVPIAGGYEVRVEPPLRAASASIEAAEEECISAYVPVLERYVARYPSLWRGWLGSRGYWHPDPLDVPGQPTS